jgi:hypothetical protein
MAKSLGSLIQDLLRDRGPLSRPELEDAAADAGYEAASVPPELCRLKGKGAIEHLSKYKGHSLYGPATDDDDDDQGDGSLIGDY